MVTLDVGLKVVEIMFYQSINISSFQPPIENTPFSHNDPYPMQLSTHNLTLALTYSLLHSTERLVRRGRSHIVIAEDRFKDRQQLHGSSGLQPPCAAPCCWYEYFVQLTYYLLFFVIIIFVYIFYSFFYVIYSYIYSYIHIHRNNVVLN